MSPVVDIRPLEELPPGERRLVEWEDLEFGVVNCNGELLASEDRCSHDDGHLLDIDCGASAVECSRDGSVFVLRTGMPKNLLAYVPIDIFPVSVADRVIKVEVD
jgi:3-phenylpropionate/trans-cinnamate dioxygenase ferredoxin subunit